MTKTGICPVCNTGPKKLVYLNPENKENICSICYFRITGKSLPVKIGICSECGNGPKKITYRHPDTGKKGNICHNCHSKFKRLENRLGVPVKSLSAKVIKSTVERPKRGRFKYPDIASVTKALEARIREGKENYPNMLAKEDMTLYRALRRLEVSPLIKRDVDKPSSFTEMPVIVLSPMPAPIMRRVEEDRGESREEHETGKSTLQGNSCGHHWVIESPDGPISRGRCKLCGITRDFPNFITVDYRRGKIA